MNIYAMADLHLALDNPDKTMEVFGEAWKDYMSRIKENASVVSDDDVVLLRFLSAVQNEVHRYAITYQKKLSKKRNIRYKLENIKGIGPAKRRSLLAALGSIKAVEEADITKLSEIKGISAADAKMIYDYFHEDEEEET